MNNKIKYSLFGVSSLLVATATFAAGRITGYKKGKTEAVKISGKLSVVYSSKDDTQPQLGFILNDIKDLDRDYIVLKVERSQISKDPDPEENVDGNA